MLSVCEAVADLVFVLDSSGSIEINGQGNWNLLLDFLVRLVESLDIGPNAIRVGLVSYSGRSTVNFLLDRYTRKDELINAIRNIPYIGDATNTAAAIEDMRTKVFTQRGDRPNIQNIAMVVTDGVSNVDQRNTVPNANRAKDDGIWMMVVGITDEVNETELQGISSTGVLNGSYWLSQTFQVSRTLIQGIVNRTCELRGGEI